ncbi:aldo/keto reductase [Candidatus Sumerlaeota bacterium]|nr:aldo/keto reductase [Candidatus Sumerlaeota bacterium]
MQMTSLGRRGPLVSAVGYGSWAISGMDWGQTEDEISKRALHAALDAGVNFIDTADNYGRGHSEELIAEVLEERGGREGIVIATKACNDFYNATDDDDLGYGPIRTNTDRDYIIFAAEQSLRRLKTDCLDILQLHSPGTEDLDRDDPWEALATLKQQGKIRHAGWSVRSFCETEQTFLLKRHADLIDVIQVRHNLLERGAEEALFPAAMRHGTGVIVRSPILFGFLTGKFTRETRFGDDDHRRMNLSPEKIDAYLRQLEDLQWLFDEFPDQTMAQVALRFTISHPACHTVIPSGKTPEQVSENSRAGEIGPLPPTTCERLGLPVLT